MHHYPVQVLFYSGGRRSIIIYGKCCIHMHCRVLSCMCALLNSYMHCMYSAGVDLYFLLLSQSESVHVVLQRKCSRTVVLQRSVHIVLKINNVGKTADLIDSTHKQVFLHSVLLHVSFHHDADLIFVKCLSLLYEVFYMGRNSSNVRFETV